MLNGKYLLVASSVSLAVVGLAASFGPVELLRSVGVAAPGASVVMVQLMGGLYVGFAMLNWTAKDNAIGGIYSRPVSLGNFTHFIIGALSLAKSGLTNEKNAVLIAFALAYAVFAILFAMLVFGVSPTSEKS